MILDNWAGHLCFWNRGWSSLLFGLRSEYTWLTLYNNLMICWRFEGDCFNRSWGWGVSADALRPFLTAWSGMSLPQNKPGHCIHFHCSGMWQTSKQFSSRACQFQFFFKCFWYMLHSNIIKTLKHFDKRKGFINCLLHKFWNREKQAHGF